MAACELAFFRNRIEGERHGARNDVACFLDVVEERDIIEAATRAELFEHIMIRLMEDAAIEVGSRQTGFREHAFDERRHGAHGKECDGCTVHVDFIIRTVVALCIFFDNLWIVARHVAAAADGDDELVVARTVRAENETVEQRMVTFDPLDKRRRRTVAKKRARGGVLFVNIFLVDACGQQQDMLCEACLNEALGKAEAVGIAGAAEAVVERSRRLRDTKL